MDERRRYQRYAVIDSDVIAQSKITVQGNVVKLVDFSLGGLCVLSRKSFSSGNTSVVVEFHDGGRIELNGAIVRVEKKGFSKWHIAIDLTGTYKLNTLRKV